MLCEEEKPLAFTSLRQLVQQPPFSGAAAPSEAAGSGPDLLRKPSLH